MITFKELEKQLDEVRMTAAMKLQQAFQREQEKTARERKAGEDLLKKKEEPKKTNEETVEEARVANSASTRAELSKRPAKPLTGKDAEKKKKESDAAWERLMAHAAAEKAKKTNEETVEEGLKPQHNMRPGWILKADPELAAKVKKNIDIAKARKASYGNPAAGKSVKEDAAVNNVGGGAIAGTQGDAGKKSVAIKMMKRKELKNFKEFTESCDCWTGYKRVPGTKPCEKGSCKKA